MGGGAADDLCGTVLRSPLLGFNVILRAPVSTVHRNRLTTWQSLTWNFTALKKNTDVSISSSAKCQTYLDRTRQLNFTHTQVGTSGLWLMV